MFFFHRSPIVGRESPILSLDGKIVGRSTRLCIHIKQTSIGPRIHTVAIDSDRDIAFQRNAFQMCIFFDLRKLPMKQKLNEIIEIEFIFRLQIRIEEQL